MSLAPVNLSRNEKKHRLQDYRTSLSQLKRLLHPNWNVILCENTIDPAKSDLSEVLQIDLSDFKVARLTENSGTQNKGIGELDMMQKGLDIYRDSVLSSKTVSYFSGRRLIPNEYLFDKAERMKASAIISNPDFIYLDGEVAEVEKRGMFNDMFFTMTSPVFMKYSVFFDENRAKLIEFGIGSEQNLYNFIEHEKIDYEWINQLGLIRRERQKKLSFFARDRIHIC